jgi:hypothetical protein
LWQFQRRGSRTVARSGARPKSGAALYFERGGGVPGGAFGGVPVDSALIMLTSKISSEPPGIFGLGWEP